MPRAQIRAPVVQNVVAQNSHQSKSHRREWKIDDPSALGLSYPAPSYSLKSYSGPLEVSNAVPRWPRTVPLAIADHSYGQSNSYRSTGTYTEMRKLESHIQQEQLLRAGKYPTSTAQEKTTRENERLSNQIKQLKTENKRALERAALPKRGTTRQDARLCDDERSKGENIQILSE